jgi:hypothetical protein
MIGTCGRFRNSIRALKKGRVDLALRELGALPRGNHGKRAYNHKGLTSKDVSSMWLEIQYGWRPLIQDVYESQKAYSALTDKTRLSRFISSRSHTYDVVSYPSGTWHSKVEQKIVLSKQVIYVAKEKLSTPRSLGLADPRSVAWELIPFSFVADWFIPIGSYLDALACIPNLEGEFVITSKIAIKGKGTGILWPNYTGAKYSSKMMDLTRSVSSSISVPKPEFIPIEDALSLGRVKNAIALLHQVVL